MFEYSPHGMYDPKVDSTRCLASVADDGRSAGYHQCGSKVRIDGKWCKLHSPEGEKARRERSQARYRAIEQRRRSSRVIWGLRDATDDELMAEVKRRKSEKR